MGQTLTHGVYLPDEGERNCYNGLAANWQLLDGAVGTIAEHTTQIAGKAPAVHTHTKSQITDFPAYGNTAGTICEGNDSRLSDARTPVAHTHGKADITDLFNSANTWGGTNSFSIANLEVQTEYALGTLPQSESAVTLFTGRTIDNNFVTNINFYQSPTKGTGLRFTIRNKWDNNGYSTAGTTRNAHFELLQSINKTAYMQWEGYVNNGLYPLANNTYDLGSSSYKWKSLNGINPGALSLPGTGGFTDIKGDITNLSGGDNTFTASYDGWVCVRSTNATVIHIINTTWAVSQSATRSTAGTLCCLCPVMSGQSFRVIVNATILEYAYIHPCKGNV